LFARLQLIFRKVADVRREKELAERRKNEPQDSSQDQLVRKIFSRFRRDKSQLQTQYSVTDLEKGGEVDTKVNIVTKSDETVDASSNGAGPTSPAASASAATAAVGSKLGRPTAKSRWSRFSSGGSMGGDSSPMSDSSTSRPPLRDTMMFSKLQNISTSDTGIPRGIQRQDTIEEGIETIIRVTKAADDPGDDIDRTDPEPNLKKSETPSLQRRLSQFQPSCSDFKEMQSAISEFKAETSKELQHINQRMNRLEDLLHDLLNKMDHRNIPRVNTEQQTCTSQFSQLLSPVSDRDSASTTTEGHHTPQISNLILRKRRSKTRTKGAAPGIPYRSVPQRTRQLLRVECEPHEASQLAASASSVPATRDSDEDGPKPPPPRDLL
jgi:potassium voltage-gated channel Eag-related subfamily H protein